MLQTGREAKSYAMTYMQIRTHSAREKQMNGQVDGWVDRQSNDR